MNYKDTIRQHTLNNADATIMACAITEKKVSDFGLMKVDETGKILDFTEKPTDPDVIERFRLSDRIKTSLGIDDEYEFLASMGNYVFFRDRLEKFLDYGGTDFGHNIIPKIKEAGGDLYAYPFNGYWKDVGKVGDYFDCNMDFVGKTSPINLVKYRMRTRMRHLPAPRISTGAKVESSILSGGNQILSGSKLKNCILGYQTMINEDVELKDCILLGADRNQYYENQLRRYNTTFVDSNTSLERVIFDKNVKIGSNVQVSPKFGSPKEREKKFREIGLKPYTEKNGKIQGDFFIDEERNILVLGKRVRDKREEVTIPDGFQG
jgi:glucose-1-phosphate adenylyltransferase